MVFCCHFYIERRTYARTLTQLVAAGCSSLQPVQWDALSLAAVCPPTLCDLLVATLDRVEAEWDRRAALGVVLAAHGYPESPRAGDVIEGLDRVKPDTHPAYHTVNIIMTGLEGKQNMTRMLDGLRAAPPKAIGGMAVTSYEDLRDAAGRMGPFKGDTDKAARNFLIFRLKDGAGLSAKVVMRPSGTEPKAKAYIEVYEKLIAEG